MTVGIGFQGGILGFGAEGTWGTGVAPTSFVALTDEGITVEEERLHSEAIPEIFTDDDEVAKGAISVSGEAEFEARYEGWELLLKHGMGAVASAESASFVVSATNKKLDFNIGSTELTATVAEGTYIAGATQATALSLCKAIYDAIVAAEAVGTYTVAFSSSTKKFTITRSTGTFAILWNTGTNKATGIATLIGYATTADDTGGLTYTSDTALVPVYAHTFTLADNLPTGLTFEVDKDTAAFTVEGGKINTLGMSIEPGGFLKTKIGIVGEDMTTGTVTASTLSTSPLVNFTQGTISFASSTVQVKSASFNLNNNLGVDRRFIGSRLIAQPMRSKKIEVNGTFTLEFDGVTQYNDFRAATSRALVLTFAGETSAIKTGYSYGLVITFPVVKLTSGVPKMSDEGIIEIELPFKAYASSTSAREMNMVLTNRIVSVA
jgi:hypothetical protein